MEKAKRAIFFWVLVILFLITTPIIVLNARGYRFDSGRGVFVYGGAITLKTNPQTIDVSLNGEKTNSKKLNRINNSYNIGGLIPADYEIEVSAKDFQSWKKKIDVHSGVAAEFWNVLLVRNNYEKTDIANFDSKKFFISPKNEFIVYAKKTEQGIILEIFNIENEINEASFEIPDWQINDSSLENIEWSPDGKFISVPVWKNLDSDFETSYLIIDIENKDVIDLGEITEKEKIRSVRWSSNDGSYLFFLSDRELFRIDAKNKEDLNLISSNVSSFDISGDHIYYVNFDNNLLFKSNLDGKGEIIQLINSFPEEKCEPISKIIVYDDSRIIFLTEGKDLYIFNQGEHDEYFRKLDSNIIGASFSNDGKKLLFWSDNEISVYFVRDELSQPVQNENEMQNITRFSKPLRNIQWFSDYEHIIFSSENYVKIIEIDPRDKINCMDIFSTKINDSHIVYNEYAEKIYFTDSKDESINFFSIDFPEKTSIFQ